MGRGVMDSEPLPGFRRHFRTQDIRQCCAAMEVQVVQYQMDGLRFRVCQCHGDRHLGELEARSIRRGEGEVPPGFGLYGAKDIGGPAALVFVIPARFPSGRCRRGWSHIGVQGDWLLIQTDDRLLRVLRPLIDFQNVFHLGDIVVIQVGHLPHFFPATA